MHAVIIVKLSSSSSCLLLHRRTTVSQVKINPDFFVALLSLLKTPIIILLTSVHLVISTEKRYVCVHKYSV